MHLSACNEEDNGEGNKSNATATKSAIKMVARAMITALIETATKKGDGNGT